MRRRTYTISRLKARVSPANVCMNAKLGSDGVKAHNWCVRCCDANDGAGADADRVWAVDASPSRGRSDEPGTPDTESQQKEQMRPNKGQQQQQ